jgi:hypothetical protein
VKALLWGDPVFLVTIASIALASIAGGTVLVARAFRGEAQPSNQDPIERVVADLFRSVPSGVSIPPSIEHVGTPTGRIRTLLASMAAREAIEAGRDPYRVGAHRGRP